MRSPNNARLPLWEALAVSPSRRERPQQTVEHEVLKLDAREPVELGDKHLV